MDNYKYRSVAKIGGYIDLVMSSLVLVFFILMAAGVTVFTKDKDTAAIISDNLRHKATGLSEKEIQQVVKIGTDVSIWILWIFVGILAIIILFNLYACIRLIDSTQIGLEANVARTKASFWRNLNVVLVIFGVAYLINSVSQISSYWLNFVIGLVDLIFRGSLLYVVCQYIGELERVPVSQGGTVVYT